MRGRKPIPNPLKRSLSHDGVHDSGGRVIPTDPQAKAGFPPVPEELEGDALLAWHKWVEEFGPMNVTTHAERAALIILSKRWAEMVLAQRHIDAHGPVIKFPNGVIGSNPHCKIRDLAEKTVMKLLTDFGATPAARARLAAIPEEPDEDDDF